MMACVCESEKDVYLPEPATLVRAEQVTALEKLFEIRFDSGRPSGHMPGQFMMVSVPAVGEAPFSISSAPRDDGSFEMVIRKVGNVTGALFRLEAGAKVGVRGPYGTHFPVDGAMLGKDLLFITGGIGLVPVRSAIQYVLQRRDDYGRIAILHGSRSPAERLFLDEVAEWEARNDVQFIETVDRGDEHWKGHVGVVTTIMPQVEGLDPANTIVTVCGPPVMYKFVLLELEKLQIPAENTYVSLERRMKCGVGKCGHCQINGLYVCQDGPVFKYADVFDVREAIQ